MARLAKVDQSFTKGPDLVKVSMPKDYSVVENPRARANRCIMAKIASQRTLAKGEASPEKVKASPSLPLLVDRCTSSKDSVTHVAELDTLLATAQLRCK